MHLNLPKKNALKITLIGGSYTKYFNQMDTWTIAAHAANKSKKLKHIHTHMKDEIPTCAKMMGPPWDAKRYSCFIISTIFPVNVFICV